MVKVSEHTVSKWTAGRLLGRTVAQAIASVERELSADAICPLTAQQHLIVEAVLVRLQSMLNS